MPQFLTGKFAWAKILAEKKNVKLTIEDNPLEPPGLGRIRDPVPEGWPLSMYFQGLKHISESSHYASETWGH